VFGKIFILFILVPLAELYLFMTLGKQLGFPQTIAIIIVTALIGAALTKSQGIRAMQKLQQATSSGKLPAREAFDGIIILLAGAVLITPGFLTDPIGFLLLVPPIRSLLAAYFGEKLKSKIQVTTPGNPGTPTHNPKPKSQLDDGNVIDV